MSEDQAQNQSSGATNDAPSNQAALPQTEDSGQTELEVLKKQCEEYLNGWKRAKADYINFKNEQEKHGRELAQMASMGAVMQFAPILENFRKAFQYVPQDLSGNAWVTGIEQIYKQCKDSLKQMGVEEYTELVGQKFDPALHQAVGQEYVETHEDDHITQEISAGYKLHGRVLLPARVIVNKKPTQN